MPAQDPLDVGAGYSYRHRHSRAIKTDTSESLSKLTVWHLVTIRENVLVSPTLIDKRCFCAIAALRGSFRRQGSLVSHDSLRHATLLARCWTLLLVLLSIVLLSRSSFCQTPSTGALIGVTLDPSGAVLPQVSVHLTRSDGTETMDAESDQNGRFGFSLIPPGTYALRISKADFSPLTQENIQIHVTETLRIQFHLDLATHVEKTQVSAEPSM